jgi:hypothetical protein
MKKYYVAAGVTGKGINTVKRKKADWIGDILHRNCLLKTWC